MNAYLKEYLKRGFFFAGFGPIVACLVLFILQLSGVNVELNGADTLIMVVSTYCLAFVHSASSVLTQIEEWPIVKVMACHFGSLYIVYLLCYLVNSWLPFSWGVIAIFTAIFIAVYLLIWAIVFITIKATSDKLNKSLKK